MSPPEKKPLREIIDPVQKLPNYLISDQALQIDQSTRFNGDAVEKKIRAYLAHHYYDEPTEITWTYDPETRRFSIFVR